uniref:Reverse transcriptase domain-containing protein n=1 Tax=Tanacetum cinerariifolium TaxID=118510 RepID=A0A6L2JIR9_TANCI|nr:hypothetical protein [Tanacetum cinerariifolium]
MSVHNSVHYTPHNSVHNTPHNSDDEDVNDPAITLISKLDLKGNTGDDVSTVEILAGVLVGGLLDSGMGFGLGQIDIDTETDDVLPPSVENDDDYDPILEEVNLFLSDNLIPPGIENFADDPEGDIRFLEELLIDDSILSHELSNSNFEDNPSIPRPPPKPLDTETDAGEEIPVMMNDKDEDVDYSSFIFVIFAKMFSLLSAESEDTIFDPGISE